MSFMDYKPAEQDYKIWLVVNPARWLLPWLFTVFAIAIVVHLGAYAVAGQGYPRGNAAPKAAPVAPAAAVVAPVAK
jgi:light-harvesting protein B-800-850 alpha chain